MQSKTSNWRCIGVAGMLVALLAWSASGFAEPSKKEGAAAAAAAQTLTGQASAVTAVVLGTITSLADTGTLTSASEPLGSALPAGSIGGLVSGEALTSATMGWTDQVVSQASLGNLAISVLGTGISASSIMSTAQAVSGAGASGITAIDGLTIGGVPVPVTGLPNQSVSLAGLSVIVNEQTQTANGIIVNALRVRTLDGLTDIAVASSRAGI